MTPVIYEWNGEVMLPLKRFANLCDKQYVVGERYSLIPHEERSSETHRHYFVAIKDAWENLPEDQAERFASPEHLRKWCLIKCGYRNERTFTASSRKEAQRIVAFLKPVDEFAIVFTHEATVIELTAKSQSMRAMGKKDFQESKQKVLDLLSGMIGVKPETLSANAGQAA